MIWSGSFLVIGGGREEVNVVFIVSFFSTLYDGLYDGTMLAVLSVLRRGGWVLCDRCL